MRKHLYAIPTQQCNLRCPHCFVNQTDDNYNEYKFLKVLNSFDGTIGLFGGEPTVKYDRLMNIAKSNNKNGISKINGISTNLLILTDELIDLYKGWYVSTSWNPMRFGSNIDQYKLWKDNCKRLSDNGISYRIMVTLTHDLIDDWSYDEFLTVAQEWVTPSLKDIKFEDYVGIENTPEYFSKADDWLCELYKHWNLPVKMMVTENNCWYYDCSNIYTLYPDGTINNECPHASPRYLPDKCLSCKLVESCRPCRLQKYCSRPNKFLELVGGDMIE